MKRLCLCFLLWCHALSAQAQDWPVTLEHRFGETTIDSPPQRVVSLSYAGHDFLLALGIKPVALRYWFGDHPKGVWPWAQDALGDAEPAVMIGTPDIEFIAALQPDLIVGQWSGMTQDEYRLLSQIAPTLAAAPGQGDYDSPWPLILDRLARATGKQAEAEAIVADLDARMAQIRAEHPDWQGQSVTLTWPAQLITYSSQDIRAQVLAGLGLSVPKAIDDRAGEARFFTTLSDEDVTDLDADVLIWLQTTTETPVLDDIVLRPTLRAYREGREVLADYDLTAALSHSSPLSLHYALDRLVPLLEAAIDGDPATEVDSMSRAGLLPAHD